MKKLLIPESPTTFILAQLSDCTECYNYITPPLVEPIKHPLH